MAEDPLKQLWEKAVHKLSQAEVEWTHGYEDTVGTPVLRAQFLDAVRGLLSETPQPPLTHPETVVGYESSADFWKRLSGFNSMLS